MKKVKNPQVYQCQYCHRKVFGEKSCGNHEKKCKRNPNNRHLCVRGCVHFGVDEAHTDGYGHYVPKMFYCTLDGWTLWSYKMDGREGDVGGRRMPLECENYIVEEIRG